MTDENKDEEIKLTSAENNLWYWLAQKAIEQDAMSPQPYGWHWLILLHYVLGFNVADVQKKLPDEHPLKSTPLPSDSTKHAFKPIIDEFKQKAGIPAGTRKEIIAIDFSKLIFNETANFSNFIFPINVDFVNTTFSKRAIFTNAVFLNITDFSNTKFSEEAGFENALFSRMSNFYMAVFSGDAEFSEVKFSQIAGFKGTTFYELAEFSNSTFEGHTTFTDAKFNRYVPHFYNAKISPDTIWERDISNWPQLNKHKHNFEQKVIDVMLCINQNAYENLAYNMKTAEKYHDEHFFFRQEMRCRRGLEKNPFILFSYWLYEKCADYGYGIERAILAWALHIFIGFLVITFIAMCGGIRYHESLSCAISASFANANPYAFFGFDSENLKECYKDFNMYAPILFAIIKVIQTIVGVGLLFLVLLTLRIRFRLK